MKTLMKTRFDAFIVRRCLALVWTFEKKMPSELGWLSVSYDRAVLGIGVSSGRGTEYPNINVSSNA